MFVLMFFIHYRDDMFLRHDSYAERMDEMNGSSPASIGSNQGLDLSPITSQRTSPMVPSRGSSPLRRTEEQLQPEPLTRETKFIYNAVKQERYGSPHIRDSINSPHGSETGCATVSAKSQPMEAQEEALNMSVVKKEEELEKGVEESHALTVSPSRESLDLRRSPLEQSEMNMSYLHRNNLMAVSHSMT